MKKILFINASLSNGGSERVMVLLANELSARGYNVTMLILNKGEETYTLNKNVNVIKVDTSIKKSKVEKKILQIKKIRELIKQESFDDIISFMQEVNVMTLLATINIKSNIIISERCNPMARQKDIWYYFAKFLYKKAKKVVIQTEQVRNMLFENIRLKCYVIPNPVNKDIPIMYSGERKKNIVAVGRLTEQKNFKMLIDAFSMFSKNHNEYNLLIYGKGPLLNELQQYANYKEISSNIKFMGFVENLDEQINNSSLYVSTSNYEGISNTMIEALAMGIPTICTDCPVGGSALMIENERNGVLIPIGDTEKLVYYMNKIVEDIEFAKYISKNALSVRSDYSIEKITDKWEKIL